MSRKTGGKARASKREARQRRQLRRRRERQETYLPQLRAVEVTEDEEGQVWVEIGLISSLSQKEAKGDMRIKCVGSAISQLGRTEEGWEEWGVQTADDDGFNSRTRVWLGAKAGRQEGRSGHEIQGVARAMIEHVLKPRLDRSVARKGGIETHKMEVLVTRIGEDVVAVSVAGAVYGHICGRGKEPGGRTLERVVHGKREEGAEDARQLGERLKQKGWSWWDEVECPMMTCTPYGMSDEVQTTVWIVVRGEGKEDDLLNTILQPMLQDTAEG